MRIGLVEEKSIVRNTLQDFLTDVGHTVLICNALDDLPDVLDHSPHSVDLILTDLVPANGKLTALMRSLHGRYPEVPFVLITGSNDILLPSEAIRCGVHAYLHKPIRLAELELMLLRLSETRANGPLQDEHTGLYQRPGFIALAQQQLRVAHRTKTELSFLMVDRNGAKLNHGGLEQQKGDRSLTELGAIVGHTFRESDIMGRLNGKDYGVLLVDTSEEGTNIAISRLREKVEAHNAERDDSRRLSVNVGVAHYDPQAPCALDELVSRADKAT